MKSILGLSVILAGLLSNAAFAQETPRSAPVIPFEVFQSIFQLGATTHQQVTAKIDEMQGKILKLTGELEEAKKQCVAASPEK